MTALRRISYQWKDPQASSDYATGVSLHSHTNQSKETLDFIANLGAQYHLLRPIFAAADRRSRARHNIPVNYAAAYWTPPSGRGGGSEQTLLMHVLPPGALQQSAVVVHLLPSGEHPPVA